MANQELEKVLQIYATIALWFQLAAVLAVNNFIWNQRLTDKGHVVITIESCARRDKIRQALFLV